MTAIDDLMEELAESIGEGSPEEEKIVSPARSNAGNLRNFGRMNDDKLIKTYSDMQPFQSADPEGWEEVLGEMSKRGLPR